MTIPMPGPPEDCYCRDGNATCNECETNGYPYPWGLCPGCYLHNGDRGSRETRLTDAECASEYWRAAFDCEDYSLSDVYGDGIIEPISRARRWMRDPRNNDQRKSTWHRFATHPHALEES